MASLIERRKMMAEVAYTWLTSQTKEYIINAFGNDGVLVIRATEAYLNNIADINAYKANMLAQYINSDPLLVCSLGLQVQGVNMPVRTITSNGTYGYIDTGISRTQGSYEVCKACTTGTSGENYLFGAMLAGSPYNRNYLKTDNYKVQLGFGDSYPNSSWNINLNQVYNIDCLITPSIAIAHFDNNVLSSSGNKTLSGNTIKVLSSDYAINRYGSRFVIYGKFTIYEADMITIIANLLPCIYNGQNGVYDMERVQWLGNANTSGSLNIGYKIYENGSWVDWTPGT